MQGYKAKKFAGKLQGWIWIGAVGILMLFFQNFTPSKPLPGMKTSPLKDQAPQRTVSILSELSAKVETLSAYSDVTELEDPHKMSDQEILARVQNQIVTSIEIAKMNADTLADSSEFKMGLKKKTVELKKLMNEVQSDQRFRRALLAEIRSRSLR